jgi:hypothetical protein
VLFHGSRANVQFVSDFSIAATLHQEFKNLRVASCDFDLIEIHHSVSSFSHLPKAGLSPKLRHHFDYGKPS